MCWAHTELLHRNKKKTPSTTTKAIQQQNEHIQQLKSHFKPLGTHKIGSFLIIVHFVCLQCVFLKIFIFRFSFLVILLFVVVCFFLFFSLFLFYFILFPITRNTHYTQHQKKKKNAHICHSETA